MNAIGYKVLQNVRDRGLTVENTKVDDTVETLWDRFAPVAAGAVVLVCALGVLGACTMVGPVASEDKVVDPAHAKLTAVAGGEQLDEPSSSQAEAGDPGSAGALPTPDPLAGLDGQSFQEIDDIYNLVEGGPLLPGGNPDEEPLDQGEAAEQFDVARATQEAKAGIADVSELVRSQAPLATFTPSSDDGVLDGRLLYVRSGGFYTANADASDIEKLPLQDNTMPTLWTPPEDPGRAWPSPDGEHVAFFAGSNAGLWLMDIDGRNNRVVHANSLPNEDHLVSVAGASQSVRLRPGQDYTLVYGPNGDSIFGVMIDDNSYHVREQGRVRVVHAARGLRDRIVTARVNGQPVGSQMRFGLGGGLWAENVGSVRLDLVDENQQVLVAPTELEVGDRQLLTWFVYGEDTLGVVAVAYPAGSQPTSGQSRLRVFNSSAAPIDVDIDGSASRIRGIAPGALSDYVGVQGVLSPDARRDAELSMYGLRAGEEPIAWAPGSDRLAFVSAADGVVDLYIVDRSNDRVTRITESPQREVNPSWSPDGRSLVWTSIDEGYGQNALFVMSGGEVTRIDLDPIAASIQLDPGRALALPHPAAWIDDSTLFLYPHSDAASQGIWAFDTESGELRPLVTGALLQPRYSTQARAWVYNRKDDGGRLYRLDADGTETMLVDGDAYGADWSPDGSRVTYGDGISTRSDGWSLDVIGADGGSPQQLTERLPILQESPPVPGPDAKRFWIDDDTIVFSRVGRDYGRRDQEGVTGRTEAGNDIENLYVVSANGRGEPRQLTDMVKTFYVNDLQPSSDGDSLAFIGFSYRNRAQQLFAVASEGGKPVRIDGAVRWFMWVD